ncbi:MAG: ABC transporter ATP-binding protein [Streptomycetaceae bacterium]|nr:MAG: ABC transporter ATP-binding protein [Streptomycetaceae bacterium]
MSSFLEISHASKQFGNVQALKDVSIDIKENEFFALLGPSGCGKTTLLRALAGLESLDSGVVTLSGSDLLSVPANKRPVNLMFQSYALFPHLNVFDNVAYGLRREKLGKEEVEQRTLEVLKTVGLSELKERRPSALSGGQKQRVALARAIVKRPKILLLDEPLSALDKRVRSEMQLELKRLQHEAGITFIIVTHDQEEAMSIADRIALMNQGEVVQIGTPIQMYTSPKTTFVADFIGTSNLISGVVDGDCLKAGDRSIKLPAHSLPNGSTAVFVVRPEDISLGSSGELVGTVISSNFYGGSSVVFIDCGLERLIKVAVSINEVPQVGTQCHLRWNIADTLVLLNA